MKELLTIQEVANLLKVSPRTIHNYRRFGGLPALYMSDKGRTIRFDPDAVAAWASARATEPSDATPEH